MYFEVLARALAPAACIIALQPGTAHAQIWIGQIVGDMMARGQAAAQEHACMSGTPMPDNEIAEARLPAISAMSAYFNAAKGGGAPLSSQFHLDGRSRWISGSVRAGIAEIDRQSDSFARAGLTLDTAPIGFVRAGDGSSALGQWVVRDAPGTLRGTYTGVFIRKSGVWRLSTLELTPASAYLDPVVQYCHKAGDVLPYRVSDAGLTRKMMEKRVANAEAKAARAEQAAASARAKADKSPNNDAAQAAAQMAAARGRNLADQLEARQKELNSAKTAEKSALADVKAAEDAKAAALARLQH